MRVIPQLLLLCFVPRLQGVTAKSNKHQPVNVLAVHGGIKQAERKRQLSRKQPAVTEQVVNTSDAAQSETSFVSEILSGTTVALASIPSSIAFANIAGLDPLVGVWSSVILGTVSSLTGLRPGLVAGAAGVVAVPLASVVKNSGKQYVGPTIVLASLMELAFSLAKGGRLIDLVSDPVMSGFLNGLGCLLLKSQFNVFCTAAGQLLPKEKLIATSGITALTAALSLCLPLVLPGQGWPTALLAIVGSTIVAQALQLPIEFLSIGESNSGKWTDTLPRFVGLPKLNGESIPTVLKLVGPAAFSIAVISILETLLAVKVVDDASSATESVDTKDQSVRALSIGNFCSSLFGGFGGCGLIPQTLLNIQSGGSGSVSVLAYAVVMAVSIVFTSSLIQKVPVSSLSGIMILVALRTIQWKPTVDSFQAFFRNKEAVMLPKSSVNLLALMVSSFLCFHVDMGSGIIAGVLLEKLLPLIAIYVNPVPR